MSSFEGMDVEEVERLAARLDLQAKAIAALVGVVDAAVAGLGGIWTGEDLDAFRALWLQTHRPKAVVAGDQLGTWVTELRRQVAQQRLASGEAFGPSSSSAWKSIGLGAVAAFEVFSAAMGTVGVRLLGDVEGAVEDVQHFELWRRLGTGVPDEELDKILIPSKTLRFAAGSLGVVGIGLGGIETYQDAQKGDLGGTVFHGVETILSIGAFLPPPAGLVCVGATVVMDVGELAWGHREQIEEGLDRAGRVANDVAHDLRGAARSVWHGVF